MWNRLISRIALVALLVASAGSYQIANNDASAEILSRRQPASTQYDQVLVVQRMLSTLGFSVGPITGALTGQSRDAIRSFQRQNFMREDGRITQSLMTFLAAHVLDLIPDGDTTEIFEASASNDSSIDVQDRSNVALVQRILTRHGFGPGRIDGSLGYYTTQAILNFQAQMDLPETGEISLELLTALGEYDEPR